MELQTRVERWRRREEEKVEGLVTKCGIDIHSFIPGFMTCTTELNKT